MNVFPQIVVRAEREVAYESPDHLIPEGTRRDNSRNPWFNKKLYRLFRSDRDLRTLKVLDVGCSGGGFVRDLLDDGHLGIGVEGSDYSKRTRRAEWPVIPGFLFTADFTGEVDIMLSLPEGLQRIMFDVVTTWEVMEHIAAKDIRKFAENVRKHLAPEGLWFMSIANYDYFVDGVNLHQTVKPKSWWQQTFADVGLHHIESLIPYFGGQFLRGNRHETSTEFHLILAAQPELAPSPPPLSVVERLRDRWSRSRPQRILAEWVTGKPWVG